MNLTNFSIGDQKAQRIASFFIENDIEKSIDDYFEKGGKLNTSHLVLKEVNVNGKMMHRWVDPNKGNQEHAEHGSKVELEHKGKKVSGTVGGVGKTGEYAIRLDKEHGGTTVNKHPHQFDSPHGEGSKKQEAVKHSPEDLENFAKKASRSGLENTIKTTKDENIKKIAEKALAEKGDKQDGESEEKDKDNPMEADEAADKIVGEKKAEEAEEGKGDINRRFETFGRFVRSVASGKGGMKSVISYGTGGVGKALTLDSKVLTPEGFVLMRDVTKETKVVTPDGKVANIKGIYPQGIRPVYELTFIDGSKVRCDEEHLWKVKNRKKDKWELITTAEMIENGVSSGDKRGWGWRYGTPFITKPFDNGNTIDFIIHPWIMGFLLGDGCTTSDVKFSVGDRDKTYILNKISELLPETLEIVKCSSGFDYSIVKTNKKTTGISDNPYTNELRNLQVFGKRSFEKSIPNIYKNTSIEQKLQLIQGLMDSDGYVREDGCSCFGSTSEQLAKDFYDLVKSFGGFANIKNKKPGKYKHNDEEKTGLAGFEVNFYLPKGYIPVSLPYKTERYKNKKFYSKALSIVDISYIGEEETQCILIDDPKHLFITDDYIVTHNTYTVQQELKKLGKREFKEGMEVGSDDYDYVKITGKATTAGLYQAMYEHNGKILMIDDCDTAITDTDEGLWKGALDTSGDGTVAYASQRPLKDSFGQPIPNRFNFNGRAIFISNLPPNKVPQPLKSRSLRVDMTMTPEETIQRIRHIAQHPDTKEYNNLKFQNSDGKDIKYDAKDLKDAVDFLDKYKHKTSDLNIRTVGSLLDIIHGAKEDGVDWVHDAKDMVLFSKSNRGEFYKALGDLGVDAIGDNGIDTAVVEVSREATDDHILCSLISRMHETEIWLKWVHLKTKKNSIHEAFGRVQYKFDDLTDRIAEQLLGLVGKDKFHTMAVMVENKQSYDDNIDPVGVAEHVMLLAFDVEEYAKLSNFSSIENLAQEMYGIGAELKYKLQLQ